ncbi:MAG: STAS domain-containing protein [Nannocystaceae bacterium]
MMAALLERIRGRIEQATLKVLRTHLADNRSALPPFRLPAVASTLTGALVDWLDGESVSAIELGEQLGRGGLGQASLLALGRALTRELADDLEPAALLRIHEFTTDALAGLVRAEMSTVLHQRDETQRALVRAVSTREDELRQVILTLSTPVMPIYGQILVLPLIGAIDEERASRITERLLLEVQERAARFILIDVSGVPAGGTSVARALLRTTRAVELLGGRAVFVGLRPEMARSLVELDLDLDDFVTMATLKTGIEWALRQLGLAIQPRAPGEAAASPRTPSRVTPTRRPSHGH